MRFIGVLLTATALGALCAPAFAQSASELTVRINQLEEQVRHLTGQNEEYAHQIRQLEQQIQQMGGTPLNAGGGQMQRPPQQQMGGAPHAGGQQPPMQPGMGQPGVGSSDPNVAPPGPHDLGTLQAGPGQPSPLDREPGAPLVIAPDFQQNDLQQNNAGGDMGAPPGVDPGPQFPPGGGQPQPGGANMATATPTGSAEEEYALGAGFLQRKDYEFAQTQFQNFLRQFPDDARAPDALYGLGESFYQRKQYNDAIEPFLEVVTQHGQSPRAADSMLRLGQTLGAIDQREQACATLNEIGTKYPRSNAKAQSVKEMQRLGCS